MKRQFKFRAFDGGSAGWGYSLPFKLGEKPWWKPYPEYTGHNVLATWTSCIIEQYTGEKDHNKVEIYEHDTVVVSGEEYYSNGSIALFEEWSFAGVVKFMDNMWLVEGEDKTSIPFCDIESEELDIVVTGNIHAK